MGSINSKSLTACGLISIAFIACASNPAFAIAIHDHPCKEQWAEPVKVDSRFNPLPQILRTGPPGPLLLDLVINLDVKMPAECEQFNYVHSQLQTIKFTVDYDILDPAKLNLVKIGFRLVPFVGDIYVLDGLQDGVAKTLEFNDYIFGAPKVFDTKGLMEVTGDPDGAVRIRKITASANGEHHYDVPAPLPILGVGVAFRAARRLRKKRRQLATFYLTSFAKPLEHQDS